MSWQASIGQFQAECEGADDGKPPSRQTGQNTEVNAVPLQVHSSVQSSASEVGLQKC